MKILDKDLGSVNVQIKDLYYLSNCSEYHDSIYKLLKRNFYKLSILRPDDDYYLKFCDTLDSDLIMKNPYIVDFDEVSELSVEKILKKINDTERQKAEVCQRIWNILFIKPMYDTTSLQKDITSYMGLYNNVIKKKKKICKDRNLTIKIKRR